MLLELEDRLVEGLSPEELRLELAVSLYRRGRLSKVQARRLSGLQRLAFDEELHRCGVAEEYGENEFRQDVASLQHLGLL